MNLSRMIVLAGAVGLTSVAFAQQTRVDRAFTATGASCEEVNWSDEALERYPNIASACQEVLERDGTYYVRFEGEVERVGSRGREITVAFEEGDTLTLTPPENLSLYIDGRRTSPRELQPGDQLNFYVPQEQFVATFFAGEPETSPADEVPISEPEEEYVAADYQREDTLPGTAGKLPLLGLGGLLLVALAAAMALYRRVAN